MYKYMLLLSGAVSTQHEAGMNYQLELFIWKKIIWLQFGQIGCLGPK